MFDFGGFELTAIQWSMLALTAFLVGVAKTGIPCVGVIAVPLIAAVWPDAKESVGLLLPLLIFADIIAAGYYRQKALWGHILRLLPWMFMGILTGFLLMRKIEDNHFLPVIGGIVLVMLGLKYWQTAGGKDHEKEALELPSHWAFAAVLGFVAGGTTMMANAAGPIMVIYMLAMRLPKTKFVGTSAWLFFIVNWIKLPFMYKLKIVSEQSLKLNATLFPIIAIGAVAGILVLKHIPQKYFNKAVMLLAAAAAIKLLLS